MVEHAEYAGPARYRQNTRTNAWTALIGAGVTLLLSPFGSMQVKSPPSTDVGAVGVFLVACFFIVLALRTSRASQALFDRGTCSAAIVVGLAALVCPTTNFWANYHDVPWIPLAAVSGIVLGGGWICGQRLIAAGFWAGTILLLAPMFRSPHPGPSSIVSGDLMASLDCSKAPDCRVTLTSMTGRDLLSDYNLGGVRLGGSVAPWLPFSSRMSFQPTALEESPRQCRGYFRIHVSRAARSWDATLTVPRWPARPNSEQTFETKGLFVKLSPVELGTPGPDFVKLDAVRLTVKCHDGGYQRDHYRFRDQDGYPLKYLMTSVSGDVWHCFVYGWQKRPMEITVGYQANPPLDGNVVRFQFPRLAPPADR